MPPAFQRILVTGADGFLGHHIVPVLRQTLNAAIVTVGRRDYDLLDAEQTRRMLRETRPDAVLHLAAKVGGIIANRQYPADFFYANLAMNTQVFDACFRAGVKKFMTFIGGCSYPAKAGSPIAEDQFWNGYPQPESACYSVAKMMMLVQSDAYRQQHGFNSIVLVPGNVYGEHDNFHREAAHVIPGMIRRFVEAREDGAPFITCFGSGRPTRDFVYAGDVAKLVPWFLLHYDRSEPINLSSGTRTAIRDLAETVKRLTGYAGEIRWDTSKPDGQIDKIFDVRRLHALGLSCDTPLETGLQKTIAWFEQARQTGEARV